MVLPKMEIKSMHEGQDQEKGEDPIHEGTHIFDPNIVNIVVRSA